MPIESLRDIQRASVSAFATGGGSFTESSTAPGSPGIGDRWLDTDTGIEYTWISPGAWVDLATTGIDFADFVQITGAQSIAGVKTFTDSPIVPAAATGLEAVPANETVRLLGGAANMPTWNTAGRPGSPSTGFMGFNTTLGCLEYWDGTYWIQEGWQYGSSVSASGSSFDATTVIPAWANEVALNVIDLSGDGTNRIALRLNGATTAYKGSSAVTANGNTVVAAQDTTGFRFEVANTVNALNGTISLRRITGNTWACSAALGNAGATSTYITGGTLALGAALTTAGFVILTSGSFDGGTVYPAWRK